MNWCKKRWYLSRGAARKALKRQANRFWTKMRIYKCEVCNNTVPTWHLTSRITMEDKEYFRINKTLIDKPIVISVRKFHWEYTWIFINTWKWLFVRRCNYICQDCWMKVSHITGRNIEWSYTFKRWQCECCKIGWHITSVNHYN